MVKSIKEKVKQQKLILKGIKIVDEDLYDRHKKQYSLSLILVLLLYFVVGLAVGFVKGVIAHANIS